MSRGRLAVGFAVLATVYLGLSAAPLSARTSAVILGVLYLGVSLAALYAALWAARRVAQVERALWWLLFAALALMNVGEIFVVSYQVLVDPRGPQGASLGDLFYIVSFVPLLIVSGMLLVGRLRRAAPVPRARFALDAGIAAVVLITATIVFVVRPLYGPGGSSPPILAAYPILDTVVLTGLVYALIASERVRWRRWEVEFAAAVGCFAVGDTAYNFLAAGGVYVAGGVASGLLDLVWIAAYVLLIAAALDAAGSRPESASADMAEHRVAGVRVSDLVPAAGAVLIIPILFWVARFWSSDNFQYWSFMIAATLIAGLVVARGALMTVENRGLLAHSSTDPLTGVFNHRHFHELLTRETERAKIAREPLSVAMIDIDDFSGYNDAYGHIAGDERLREIADAIASQARSGDSLCRIGGDVFGLIMPSTTDIEAHRLCRGIARRLAATTPPDSPRTTASMGIATMDEEAPRKESLIHQADGALYWAKLNGGNEIVIYDERVVDFLGPEERIRQVEQQAQLRTVEALAAAVDARDAYTHSHSKTVSIRAVTMGRREGLEEHHLKLLEMAALLHDIGKIGIPDSVLRKPERLSDEDLAMIWDHPVLGEKILDSTALKEILPWVLSHHERWDGTGYPVGLKREHIPLESRIIAICDSFDAMTSDRPYRKAMSVDDALSEIIDCAGTQFDPRLARKFVELIHEELPAEVRETIAAHPSVQAPGEGTPR